LGSQGHNAAPARSFSFELRAFTGGAALEHVSFEGPTIVELAATTLGVGARAGWFAGSHVQLGLAASVAKYWRAGKVDVRDAEAFNDQYWQFDDSPVHWEPLGAFLEFYPTRERVLVHGRDRVAAVHRLPRGTEPGRFDARCALDVPALSGEIDLAAECRHSEP
jgi:hypothetical protein